MLAAQVYSLERLSRWNIEYTPLVTVPRVWPDMRRDIGFSEALGATAASLVLQTARQTPGGSRRRNQVVTAAYVIRGFQSPTNNPADYLLQIQTDGDAAAEEVD
jgi:hypothetical protein